MRFPLTVSAPFAAPREDPPEPIAVITDPVIEPPARGSYTCEFCGCRNTAAGEVLSMSARARELRELEDRHADSERAHGVTRDELTRARETIAGLEGTIRELENQKRRNWLTSSEIP